jgi:hypothetical protein
VVVQAGDAVVAGMPKASISGFTGRPSCGRGRLPARSPRLSRQLSLIRALQAQALGLIGRLNGPSQNARSTSRKAPGRSSALLGPCSHDGTPGPP